VKRGRGRPRLSNREVVDRFYGTPNRVAAQLADTYVRTYFLRMTRDGRPKPITQKEAVWLAIEDFDAHWLVARDGKPPRRPDPEQVMERLRRGRTEPKISSKRGLLW
jgi:hypothetical protein